MSTFPLKPTHAPVKAYYATLSHLEKHGFVTEGNTRDAFAALLRYCARSFDLELTPEVKFIGTGKQRLRADGILYDKTSMALRHGYWEAKDSDDKLPLEIRKKIAAGYPTTNTLFQSPDHATLYQHNRIAFDDSIRTPEKLVEVLEMFFVYKQKDIADWREAVEKFAGKLPELASDILTILNKERQVNAEYRVAYQAFAELCRQSINPDLQDSAIEKMLVQHLLTERIFRNIFDNKEFLTRNVIAVEIEKVIQLVTRRHFSRDTFLGRIERFYTAIEAAARQTETYEEKQQFLNTVYEKFFQRFDAKQADTHGIVYTPQPIVDFMVRSVDEILKEEFGKSLSHENVHILDPFTGTGNFITRIMQQIKRSCLEQKYAKELHCNEIMLLPYYIASMNIEHAYMERMGKADELGEYRAFEGICLVDTFDLSEARQSSLFTTVNAERVNKQRSVQEIRVVLGNPPYNASQKDENDQNANRKYPALDEQIRRTYIADSTATLSASSYDPYMRAFRWASDRIGDHGVICYVTNSGFLDGIASDGIRKHLLQDFDKIYVIDLGGNVIKNPKLSGTTHNVFGIQVGVAITVLVKRTAVSVGTREGKIVYTRLPWDMKKPSKYKALEDWVSIRGVPWKEASPDRRFRWFSEDEGLGFDVLYPLAAKTTKTLEGIASTGIFQSYSNAPKSNNDKYVYSFSPTACLRQGGKMRVAFNEERNRWLAAGKPKDRSAFLRHDPKTIKWIRRLKKSLSRKTALSAKDTSIRCSLYRPFTAVAHNFTRIFNEDIYSFPKYFPTREALNTLICVPSVGARSPFWILAVSRIPIQTLTSVDANQCFPFYIYDEDGNNRRENITDSALAEFRTNYADKKITKWNIFHATYAVLHHPEYRTRYAANLKRELPRIPFPPDFHAFAAAGRRLMELHIDYEKQPEYPLEHVENPSKEVAVDYRVEKMRLNPKDRSELRYNDFLTLRGIPAAAFDYRLGNRSALEWVIDQYRISTDPRSGIRNDPNREDDPTYILRLIGQVITVSLETQKIIASLPSLNLGAADVSRLTA